MTTSPVESLTQLSGLSRPCVICGEVSHRHFRVQDYWIRRCRHCGHQFAEIDDPSGHVQRVYGDDYFSRGGAGYGDYLSEERLLLHRGRWYATKMSTFCTPGSVLDIGAASGFALQAFHEAGWTTCGVEPNVTMATNARERFALHVETAAFESWRSDRKFDLVMMLQVLPHFLNPAAALAKVRLLLRPGGFALIETWDRTSRTARLLGDSWHEYSPPSVLHWFSRDGLVRLASHAGFHQAAQGRAPKWISAAHAKSLLAHHSDRSAVTRILAAIARIFPDRLALPYPLDDLFWILLQRA